MGNAAAELAAQETKITQRKWPAANQRGCTVYGLKNEAASEQPNSA
jgi:hypothetical protein